VTTHDRKKKIIRSRMKALGEPYSVAKRQIEQIMPSDEHVRSYELTAEQKARYADFFGIETTDSPDFGESFALPSLDEFMEIQQKAEIAWKERNRRALIDDPEYVVTPFEPAKYEPKLRVSNYSYGGANESKPTAFAEYLSLEEKLKEELGVKTLAVAPIGDVDDEGKEMRGSVGGFGFRVWQSDEDASYTHPLTDDWMREHACRAKFMPVLRSVFEMDDLILLQLSAMTRKTSKLSLVEIKVVFPTGTVLATLLDKIPELEKSLGVNFVRVSETDTEGLFVFFVSEELDLSEPIDTKGLQVLNPPSIVLQLLYKADAAYKQHLGHHLIEQATLPMRYKTYSVWVKVIEARDRFESNPNYKQVSDKSYYRYLEEIRTGVADIYKYEEDIDEYIARSFRYAEFRRRA